ncbi:MAG: hypothetical protein GY793_07635 [Proteobacteria bacterium]|nr:hypothetical protein [Pseudomonadota bacterium]
MKQFNTKTNKKAAMFGLDARVALAIFAALSVITGVTLYSAIKKAQFTAVLTEMREVGKAWEAYYIDTGTNLPQVTTIDTDPKFYRLENKYLVEKPLSVTGWKGPYLKSNVAGSYLKDQSKRIYVMMYNNYIWGNPDWFMTGYCTPGDLCSIWVSFRFANDIRSVAKDMNKAIDGLDGVELESNMKGNFRWEYLDSVTYLYLKIAPIKNPHD